ncbi:MAG: hypothetical protein ABI468_01670 [Candidatus Nanopelagicales bacterium]
MTDDPAEMVTSRELRARGIPARTQRRLVQRGEWYQVVPGVIACHPVGRLDFVRASLLRAGPRAALSHRTAAELWLDRELTSVVHVGVPSGVTISGCDGVRYHQLKHWRPPARWHGLEVVEPAVAAAQVAADDEAEADRRALVTALVQRRLTTAADVAEVARFAPRRRFGQIGRLVEEVLAGAESGPEAAFWRAQVEHRMPLPTLNHPLAGGARRLDGYLEALRAGYEVQSREHHAGTWLADTARMAEIVVHHAVVLLPILVPDIDHRLDSLLADLESFWRTRAHDLGVAVPRHVPPTRWRP